MAQTRKRNAWWGHSVSGGLLDNTVPPPKPYQSKSFGILLLRITSWRRGRAVAALFVALDTGTIHSTEAKVELPATGSLPPFRLPVFPI